jgi:16S rRNA (adenine1518-N6/adenine1519-N6)-dimethyltransferase
MNRSDPQQIRDRLQRAGLWSKKRLGQHFLVDEEALTAIVEAADLSPTDVVVEIGPGLGVLSEQLLSRVEKVLAFELDEDMELVLHQDLPKLTVVLGDVLQTAHAALEGVSRYKVVANIPYNITTPILRLFLEGGLPVAPESMTLLVQKEVGKRLAAKAGEGSRGYLSVVCEYFSEMTYVRDVPAKSFFPAPEVDSGIIHLKSRAVRLISVNEERTFLKFVHASFAQKRKQLKNVLAGIKGVASSEVLSYLRQHNLPDTIRAQELTIEQWVDLYTNPFN